MPLPKKEILDNPVLFSEWLSKQSKRCQKKWSNPDKIRAWQKTCGRPGKKGETSPNWKGDNIKYNSLHLALRRIILKPEVCQHCGQKPKRLELCNINGEYNRDPANYIWLCTTCHRKMDGFSYKRMKIKTQHDLFFNQFFQEFSALLGHAALF